MSATTVSYADVRPSVAEFLRKRLAGPALAVNPYLTHAEDELPSRIKILTAITDLAWNPVPALDLLRYWQKRHPLTADMARDLALWINVLDGEAKARKSIRPPRGPMTGSSKYGSIKK